jgi:hypothetical protein
MTKKEKFDAVLNSFRENGLAPGCSVWENDEESDNCPVYDTDCCDLCLWEHKNINCGGFQPIEGWEEAYDASIKKESEVEDL